MQALRGRGWPREADTSRARSAGSWRGLGSAAWQLGWFLSCGGGGGLRWSCCRDRRYACSCCNCLWSLSACRCSSISRHRHSLERERRTLNLQDTGELASPPIHSQLFQQTMLLSPPRSVTKQNGWDFKQRITCGKSDSLLLTTVSLDRVTELNSVSAAVASKGTSAD